MLGERYRLLSEIGRGGMGIVWRAYDTMLEREIAIKRVTIAADLQGDAERLRKQALKEARTAARVNHPGIVTVYDILVDEEQAWIIMELLHASSMSELIRENGPLPVGRAIAAGREILAALGAAHAVGVLHRDIKPSNILLTTSGAVLTDFGIATIVDETTHIGAGSVAGTPGYIAPERLRGQAATPASDLWAVGATLYAAITGRAPFGELDEQARVWSLLNSEPSPPENAGALRDVLAGLLARDPGERLSLEAAAQALEAIGSAPSRSAPSRSAPSRSAPSRSAPSRSAPSRSAPSRDAGQAPTLAELPPVAPESVRRPRRRPARASVVAAVIAVSVVASALILGARLFWNSLTVPARETAFETPKGFTAYKSPTGWSLAVPVTWQRSVSEDGKAVTWLDPDTRSRFLRIDESIQEDRAGRATALEIWEWYVPLRVRKERAFPGYSELQLEEVDYRGTKAADWEFLRRAPSTGTTLHVLNRAYLPDESHGYAIYFSAPEKRWHEDVYLRTFLATFRPAD
ncbi:serine/threonine-protein kinase [Nonomuraea coxensis]|uniref:serine/threonine-protein kinase n=1 Tax=Nonomuraea coxensis TaxID=404386 RepID=UPI00036BD66C|nr:serine/threonine-protein kinase [Nonomuraea coxensis]